MKTEQNKKHPKITIREMNLDDLAPVYHLGEKLFTALEVPNLYRTWDEYELVELFSSDSDLCLVAESEKKTHWILPGNHHRERALCMEIRPPCMVGSSTGIPAFWSGSQAFQSYKGVDD